MSVGPFRRQGRFYDTQSEFNRLLNETFGGSGQLPRSRMVQPRMGALGGRVPQGWGPNC